MFSLEGKVVVVTGAASGIGRATAGAMAAAGATVHGLDLFADAVEAAVDEIGYGATGAPCNVTDREAVDAAIDDVVARHGRVDVAVNVAGVLHFEQTHKVTDDEWHRVIDVNLNGTFYVTRAALRHMLPAGGGTILNTASSAAFRASPWSAAYGATKGAVVALTQSIAVEYGRQGIRCNAVAPAGVRTAMMNEFRFPDGVDQSLIGRIMPFDGELDPVDIANAFVYLASDEADRVNGITIKVDDAMMA